MKVNITFVFQEFYTWFFFSAFITFISILVNLGNHMLPVTESAIQTISLSTRKLKLPRILCIHKYWKIKHIRNMHFLFFPPFKQTRGRVQLVYIYKYINIFYIYIYTYILYMYNHIHIYVCKFLYIYKSIDIYKHICIY